MKRLVVGVILAGGDGTRMKVKGANKVTSVFRNKPLIVSAVSLFQKITNKNIVVVGAYQESVKKCLEGFPVDYVYQAQRLGTAHAVSCCLTLIPDNPDTIVLVGYGDHLFRYSLPTVKRFVASYIRSKADMTFVTSQYKDINKLAYGRVLRDKSGHIRGIVEQKDASEDEKKIREFNAGLYCFRLSFLKAFLPRIGRSAVTSEYYLTDLIQIAVNEKKRVKAFFVPFHEVGIGINTQKDLWYNSICN